MNRPGAFVSMLIGMIILLPSCATIVGGNNYNALISVTDQDDARISHRNVQVGKGNAFITLPRKEADQLTLTVSMDGCPTEEYQFNTKKIRWGTLVGSLFFGYPTPAGIPIPLGPLVDFATGAVYKPDESDFRIVKGDYNNFYYNLSYECDPIEAENPTIKSPQTLTNSYEQLPNRRQTKEEKLIELKELFDKGLITEEEHKKARQDILGQ